MALKRIKIEKLGKPKAGRHKEMKKERNRRIRRVPKTEIPNTKKYTDYEF